MLAVYGACCRGYFEANNTSKALAYFFVKHDGLRILMAKSPSFKRFFKAMVGDR